MLFPDARLIVFAKAPVVGQVKSRLIPDLGSQTATELYRLMATRIVRLAAESEICPIEVWCYPDCSHNYFQALKSQFPITLHRQLGKDLGFKMYHAATQVSQRSNQLVIVGCDCPQLSIEHLLHAFQTLSDEQYDAVVTPAHDGGYVLIGMNTPHIRLFDKIDWGTPEVMAQTRDALEELSWRWKEFPGLHDLDMIEDLEDIVAHLPQYPLDGELKAMLIELSRKT